MNTIEKYLHYKQSLIYQYSLGDLTKSEYLEYNYVAVMNLNLKPFKNIDTIEKGLFNYQYYNALAKEASSIANSCSFEQKLIYNEKTNLYYYHKDNATKSILQLIDFNVKSAYYIKVKSKYLKGKLCEIVLYEYDMILHTTNEMIQNMLKKEMKLDTITKMSAIDSYINTKY